MGRHGNIPGSRARTFVRCVSKEGYASSEYTDTAPSCDATAPNKAAADMRMGVQCTAHAATKRTWCGPPARTPCADPTVYVEVSTAHAAHQQPQSQPQPQPPGGSCTDHEVLQVHLACFKALCHVVCLLLSYLHMGIREHHASCILDEQRTSHPRLGYA